MKIGVTGATGFIGSHLVEALLDKGHEPVCLIRKTSNLQWLPETGLSFKTGDLRNPDSLKDFVTGLDGIIHLAGLTKARNEADYMDGNYRTTVTLVEAIRTYNPSLQRFLFASSQAAVGPSSDGIPLTEEAPPHPISAYGRSKLAAERFLKAQKDFPFTIIRPPAVYGPRDRDVYAAFKMCRSGIVPLVGKHKYVSLVFVKNLVKGIELAFASPLAIGKTYFIADEGIFLWDTLMDWIADALGKHPIRIRIPENLLIIPAEMSGLIGKILNRPMLLNREKIMEIKQHYWTVDITRAKTELGYRPDFTTPEGIRLTAEWYIKNGWL
ncbi:MAG: NAD(P)-dependent oxidoreductase [Calditrichaeota bacterium]|nr:NAD(P)-dependent oxidoreductase [Calditrichota bacterium]